MHAKSTLIYDVRNEYKTPIFDENCTKMYK